MDAQRQKVLDLLSEEDLDCIAKALEKVPTVHRDEAKQKLEEGLALLNGTQEWGEILFFT